MKIKEFSQKYNVALFFTTIALLVILVFIIFSGFSRPGPRGMGGSMPRGDGFYPPAQGQNIPQQGSQGAPADSQGPTGSPEGLPQ